MELAVQKREKFGKATKKLREQGLIPAELYGKGVQNLHLSIPLKEFRKVLKQAGESTMINVVVSSPAGEEKRPAIIYDVITDPVSDEIIGADLYQVRLDEKVKIKIPLEFTGESQAVKNKNGILVKVMQELEVEALPADIPRSLVVDISKLEDIGNSVYVKDLKIGNGVKVSVGPESVVATVTAKMTEEQEAKLAAEVKPEEIKVETEEKKTERDAAKAAAEASSPASPAGRAGKPAAPAEAAKPAAGKPAPEKK
ncbi:MAG: 50S ribosomal protein L25 [Candidatus Giovannonibacteria bacterium GW2011_GWB1_47_6b]|uniref:Large ribosomal subunit protein bL25 n=1 Tax=Candidatus Giovannonibacteria bacterium GW2011_GWB1_47_6b TaxID=1618655 RepID=A0A0G1T6L1_9BACT|nr:MAG: 50S ribosomal protein L25 [Candidatus Giovannonibacteria bacterium GW2011_GWB1_47_6b]